jgi:hypothetical protein
MLVLYNRVDDLAIMLKVLLLLVLAGFSSHCC